MSRLISVARESKMTSQGKRADVVSLGITTWVGMLYERLVSECEESSIPVKYKHVSLEKDC